MRTVFIVLGAASIVYGGYLLHQRSKARCSPSTSAAGSSAGGINPADIVTGPTNGGNEQPVDNSMSMVEHFGSPRDKFPPTTYIGIPVAGYSDEGAVYQPIQF